MDTAKAMMVTISAFSGAPEFAQDYVRDLRVRWAPGSATRTIWTVVSRPAT